MFRFTTKELCYDYSITALVLRGSAIIRLWPCTIMITPPPPPRYASVQVDLVWLFVEQDELEVVNHRKGVAVKDGVIKR